MSSTTPNSTIKKSESIFQKLTTKTTVMSAEVTGHRFTIFKKSFQILFRSAIVKKRLEKLGKVLVGIMPKLSGVSLIWMVKGAICTLLSGASCSLQRSIARAPPTAAPTTWGTAKTGTWRATSGPSPIFISINQIKNASSEFAIIFHLTIIQKFSILRKFQHIIQTNIWMTIRKSKFVKMSN